MCCQHASLNGIAPTPRLAEKLFCPPPPAPERFIYRFISFLPSRTTTHHALKYSNPFFSRPSFIKFIKMLFNFKAFGVAVLSFVLATTSVVAQSSNVFNFFGEVSNFSPSLRLSEEQSSKQVRTFKSNH
jgi:hypothetical protein